jgi:hypothetical protein
MKIPTHYVFYCLSSCDQVLHIPVVRICSWTSSLLGKLSKTASPSQKPNTNRDARLRYMLYCNRGSHEDIKIFKLKLREAMFNDAQNHQLLSR